MLLFQDMLEGNFHRMIFDDEYLTEEQMQEYIELGYIECKKGWFGKRKYVVTEEGLKYLEAKMLDKTKYIQ